MKAAKTTSSFIFLTRTVRASGGVAGIIEGVAEATQIVVQRFSVRAEKRSLKK